MIMSEAISTITEDGLAVLRRKFHFPNDLIILAAKKSDRARSPPPGYFTISEFTLRAGVRFPLAPELIEIFKSCGVAISQYSFRALVVIVGLTVFFRERSVSLNIKSLCKMCKFSCDAQSRVSYRGIKNWVDFNVRDPSKNWSSGFFFVKNEWSLPEKWGRLANLPDPSLIRDEEMLQILGIPDAETLRYELHHIGRFITEDKLFKTGLSIQAGRSHSVPLKRSIRNQEEATRPLKVQKQGVTQGKTTEISPKKNTSCTHLVLVGENDDHEEGVLIPTLSGNAPLSNSVAVSNPLKLHIPEDVLKHTCTGRQRAEEVVCNCLLSS